MSVTILRESAFFRGSTRLHIYLNGEKVDTITSGEKKEIDVPGNGALLKVSQFGGKSNTLKVYKGDQIRLGVTPWAPWFLMIFLVLLPATITYFDRIDSGIILILALIIYFGVYSFFKSFSLIKVPSSIKE
ncbi:hypothetical protein [Alkalibacterium sp. 20]|uniref:hypothetical protein n=1 Tax=Alkalibacterium sp. 20 TaxID=1798803 RepID=UPI0009003410|nr:hypothetical protein [Alkalibacterium sp. 20]OJF91373.1 hypothetical protein AX762_11135 [Alkalibacterium sp. 20]